MLIELTSYTAMNLSQTSKSKLYAKAEKLKTAKECIDFLKTLACDTDNHLRSAVWNTEMSYDIIERLDKAQKKKSEK